MERDLEDLVKKHSEKISNVENSKITPVGEAQVAEKFSGASSERAVTECWIKFLRSLRLKYHLPYNSSNTPIGGSTEKPDVSLMFKDGVGATVCAKRRQTSGGNAGSTEEREEEALKKEALKLVGWILLDLLLEVKESISDDGKDLNGKGKDAAAQAFQRLGRMRYCALVGIADKKYIQFFHASEQPRVDSYWTKSKMLPIHEGIVFMQKFLIVMGEEWKREDSPRARNLQVSRCLSNNMSCYLKEEELGVVGLVHKAQDEAKADVYSLRRSFEESLAVKLVVGEESDACIKNRIDALGREGRRLKSLARVGLLGVPKVVSQVVGVTSDEDDGVQKWKLDDGSDICCYAIVLQPLAAGGTLEMQHSWLRGRSDGGEVLCRIMKKLVTILDNAHRKLSARGHWATHGDVKPSNILLTATVLESGDPEVILADWEHSMRLEGDLTGSPSFHEVGDVGGASSSGGERERTERYYSAFTPFYCARKQQTRPDTAHGPEVDWEALFYTFVSVVSKQKLYWMTLVADEGTLRRRPPKDMQTAMLETRRIVKLKENLLRECKSSPWEQDDDTQTRWTFGAWSGESIGKIKELLSQWAEWILENEFADHDQVTVERLGDKLESVCTSN